MPFRTTPGGLSREVLDRMYKEAAGVLWRAGNEHPSVDEIMAMVKELFIDPTVRDCIRELLVPSKVAASWEQLPAQTACGIAVDAATANDGNWTHRNVIAQYLTVAYGQEACVDYHGITIAQSAIDLVFAQDLVWVPLLLRACDTLLVGRHMPVPREWCLAFCHLIQGYSWEELLPYWDAFAGHTLAEPKYWTPSPSKTIRPWVPGDWWMTPGMLRQRLLIAWLFCSRLTSFCAPTASSLLWHAERWLDYWLLSGDDSGSDDQIARLLYGLGALIMLDHLSRGKHAKLADAWQVLEIADVPIEQAVNALARAVPMGVNRTLPLFDEQRLLHELFVSEEKQEDHP